MNRTIKDATVRRYHYDSHDQLRAHLATFVQAYNYARRLKTLKGLTPYEFICKAWTLEPERFTLNPLHQMPGLNSSLTPQWILDGRVRRRILMFGKPRLPSGSLTDWLPHPDGTPVRLVIRLSSCPLFHHSSE